MGIVDIVNGLNVWAFKLAAAYASPMLNSTMSYIAESFLIVLPVVFFYLVLKDDKDAYVFAISVVLFYVVGTLIKLAVQEPRPCSVASLSWINHSGCESTFSFHSNHATVLTGLVIFLRKYKLAAGMYAIWLLVVLAGRVYLGQHYLTDVIAGMVISAIMAIAVYRNKSAINGRLLFFKEKAEKAIMAKIWNYHGKRRRHGRGKGV